MNTATDNGSMGSNSVLVIGLDPRYADFSQFPELSHELVSSYIAQEIDRVRDLGVEVQECLLSPDEAGLGRLDAILQATQFDCVVIGAGLREPGEFLLLFEEIVNIVHQRAPRSTICFNSNPADTIEAVQRQLKA